MLSPEIRPYAGPVFMASSTIGSVILGALSWLFLDWKILLRVTYGLGFVSVFYFWIVPESFRWMLSKEKNYKVAEALLKVARINGIEMTREMRDVLENRPKDIILENDSNKKTNIVKSTFRDIFRHPKFCLRLFACAFCWITNVFVFSGLSYTSISIGGNKFVSFILVALVDIPGELCASALVNRIGRKMLLVITYYVSGTALMVSAFVTEIYWIKLLLYLVGKFSIEAAFSTTYIFTSEILPTSLRHRLFGLCSSFGRIGSIVSSQAPLLQDIYKPLPVILFAGSAIIAGTLSLTFPETLNSSLPETIEDSMLLGKKRNVEINSG